MKRFLREYFSFSRSELRIIVILSALIIFSFFLRILMPVPEFQKFKLTAEDQAEIDSFIKSLEKISYEKKEAFTFPEETGFLPEYRDFDPNIVTTDELEEMGFPEFLSKNLVRYRGAGGKFRKKEDMKKLYGFSDSIYNLWEANIIIPVSEDIDTLGPFSFPVTLVEINSADSVQLLLVNGIGPYFAGKIIRYRNRLGGFINLDQLLEIRGMDPEKLQNLRNQVIIDTLFLVKINLNTATINDFKSHPYISPRLAESLVKYKEFAGSIRNIDELLENRIITMQEFNRLRPYIIAGENNTSE